MHILFLTHYFPPEVNAPASRTYENSKRWVRAGHQVTVITCAPNHPAGVLYPGYRNSWYQWSEIDRISVLRVKTYLTANQGFLKRIVNYLSYLICATCFSCLVRRVDVVVSTSPQFFCGIAGRFVSWLKGCPWVLEIRDLWPESIKAVGAIKNDMLISLLECVESWMYRGADRIVSVTDSFKLHIIKRGVDPRDISVVKNGADLERFLPSPKENAFREEHGLKDKFVASYVGTHGMAHGLDTIFGAAQILKDQKEIVFLLVGDGAERERLLREKEERGLTNIIMLPQQPKDSMPGILAGSDVCLVLLKKTELFKTVIPSKIFEAMAMERPVILAVEGESKLMVEMAGGGLCIEPENPDALAAGMLLLHQDRNLARQLGKNGRGFVEKFYDRENLALDYLELLSMVGHAEASTC